VKRTTRQLAGAAVVGAILGAGIIGLMVLVTTKIH